MLVSESCYCFHPKKLNGFLMKDNKEYNIILGSVCCCFYMVASLFFYRKDLLWQRRIQEFLKVGFRVLEKAGQ